MLVSGVKKPFSEFELYPKHTVYAKTHQPRSCKRAACQNQRRLLRSHHEVKGPGRFQRREGHAVPGNTTAAPVGVLPGPRLTTLTRCCGDPAAPPVLPTFLRDRGWPPYRASRWRFALSRIRTKGYHRAHCVREVYSRPPIPIAGAASSSGDGASTSVCAAPLFSAAKARQTRYQRRGGASRVQSTAQTSQPETTAIPRVGIQHLFLMI